MVFTKCKLTVDGQKWPFADNNLKRQQIFYYCYSKFDPFVYKLSRVTSQVKKVILNKGQMTAR